MDCIFCKMVQRVAPASKVLETKRILVLIPLKPKARGHVLVVPKDHVETLHDVPRATLHEIIESIVRIARAMRFQSYNVLQNTGPDSGGPHGPPPEELIAHIHFHLIPRTAGDGVELLSRSQSTPSRDDLDRMAAELRGSLGEK